MSDCILNPKLPPQARAKRYLAWLITAQYHGEDDANRAAEEFDRIASGGDPDVIPEVFIPLGIRKWPRFLVELGLATSTSQARDLIKQGGVTYGPLRNKVISPDAEVEPGSGLVVRVGKRKVVLVRFHDQNGDE